MATNTNRLQGLETAVAIKAPCRVATTAAITLSGLQTVDGVALAANDRVVVKDQVDHIQNGIWNAQSGAWTRALDFDGSRDVVDGTYVGVRLGSTNGNTYWRVSGTDPIAIGASAITWGTTAPLAGPKGDKGDRGDTGLSGNGSGDMLASQNLNDLADKPTARTNLGVGDEAIQDLVAALVAAGTGISVTYNDAGATLTIALVTEAVQDIVGALLAAGTGITVTYNDAGNVETIAVDAATAAQFLAATAGKVLTADKVWEAVATPAVLTDAATVAVDMGAVHFTLTIAGNRTLGNPTSAKPGQMGRIVITQGSGGNHTLGYGSDWEFAGTTPPVLSTAAGAKDVLYYDVLASGSIFGSLNKALA